MLTIEKFRDKIGFIRGAGLRDVVSRLDYIKDGKLTEEVRERLDDLLTKMYELDDSVRTYCEENNIRQPERGVF